MPILDRLSSSREAVLERLYSLEWVRRTYRLWYPLLTRRLGDDEVLFLNYGFEEDPPTVIPLRSDDEPDRACIQLYHHVAAQVELNGRNVLEVSCGHGGGAAYLMRTFKPQRYTALDWNPDGVQFCAQRHQMNGLVFVRGDAQNLPFANDSFDVVINVEASHCYPALPAFFAEVSRVLRPTGHFLYADRRFKNDVAKWEAAIAAAPLRIVQSRNITAEVLRGIHRNSARSLELVARHLPRALQFVGRAFAGVEGSFMHQRLTDGGISYRSYCFENNPTGSENVGECIWSDLAPRIVPTSARPRGRRCDIGVRSNPSRGGRRFASPSPRWSFRKRQALEISETPGAWIAPALQSVDWTPWLGWEDSNSQKTIRRTAINCRRKDSQR